MPRFEDHGGFETVEIDRSQRLESALRMLRKQLRWLVPSVLGVIFALTSYYQVEPDEVGVVTRFGKYVDETGPGPHFKLPLGIERVIKLPVQRQLKQEFGFSTVDGADYRDQASPTRYKSGDEATAEATMLTGDLNVANVEWIVQYQIRNPFNYLFKVHNPGDTFRDLAEASMRSVIGDRSVTEVLTIGREEIQIEARKELQELCDRYEMGIEVLQLVLQDVNPPDPVKPSFNEVNQAIQERERKINEAMAQYNRVIPEAKGRAEQIIQTAQGYATERINRAHGESTRFRELQAAYARAREVTRTRMYFETMSEVLPNAGERIWVDASLKGIVPLLELSRFDREATKGHVAAPRQ